MHGKIPPCVVNPIPPSTPPGNLQDKELIGSNLPENLNKPCFDSSKAGVTPMTLIGKTQDFLVTRMIALPVIDLLAS